MVANREAEGQSGANRGVGPPVIFRLAHGKIEGEPLFRLPNRAPEKRSLSVTARFAYENKFRDGADGPLVGAFQDGAKENFAALIARQRSGKIHMHSAPGKFLTGNSGNAGAQSFLVVYTGEQQPGLHGDARSLLILQRSFFQNVLSGQRVFDKPSARSFGLLALTFQHNFPILREAVIEPQLRNNPGAFLFAMPIAQR